MTQARDTGELVNDVGTAASADVQTSTTDVTVGRVVINGGHGLGGDGVAVDWNAPTASILAESSLNSPIGGTSVLGVNVKSGTTQSAFVGRNERFFGRTIEAGVVQPWHELYTGANYQPETSNGIGVVKRMANNSGGSISNQATVAGSSLLFFQSDSNGITVSAGAASGTWMNVTGLSVAASNRGDFVRIA